MLNITGLSHICINVDDINTALVYYSNLLGAEPFQIFPHLKNEGFARSAGFGEAWSDVDVSIAFMNLPNGALTLELMEYHSPAGQILEYELATTDQRRVGHVALKVSSIDGAFEHVKSQPCTKLISAAPDYRPTLISSIEHSDLHFFDPELEANLDEKQTTADIIGGIRYFYFVDRYGIQWECEEGHHDIGDPTTE